MTSLFNNLTFVQLTLSIIVAGATVVAIMQGVYRKQATSLYKNCPIGKETLEELKIMHASVTEMNERGRVKATVDIHRDNMLDALVEVSEIQLRLMQGDKLNGEVAIALKTLQYHKRAKRESTNQILAEEVNNGHPISK